MSDDIDDHYLKVLAWMPPRDRKLLREEPLLAEMYQRILALGLDDHLIRFTPIPQLRLTSGAPESALSLNVDTA